MEKTALQIPIIIPSYEPDEKLPALLEKLKEAGFENIVIVDDGSGEKYAPFLPRQRSSLGAGFCIMPSIREREGRLKQPLTTV